MSAPIFKKFLPLTPLLLSVFPTLAGAQVVIDEVYYSPKSSAWVEIYNGSSAPIDLTQYKILDAGAAINGHGISVSSGVNPVPPGGYAVIGTSGAISNFGSVSWPLFKSALAPSTGGDTFTLKSGTSIVDSVTYSSAQGANGDGNSLQKIGTDWIVALPTPGAVNNTTPIQATSSASTTSQNSTTDDTNTQNQNSNTETETSVLTDSTPSAHYGATSITFVDNAPTYRVGAGRDRIATTETPLEFRATSNIENIGSTSFDWNFGDGTVINGPVVSHAYAYPGEYVVVLHASSLAGQAVARVNVSVVAAELAITYASPERIEITNHSKSEINLFGRALVVDGKSFVFPLDTLLKAGQKISFAQGVTKLSPTSISQVALEIIGNPLTKAYVPPPKTPLPTPKVAVAYMAVSPPIATEFLATSTLTSTSTPDTPQPSVAKRWLETIKHFFGLK